MKEQTIICLQKTVNELRSTIDSIHNEDRNCLEKKLNQILFNNDQLSKTVENLLDLSKEGRANALSMIENSNHLTQQNKLVLEKENMVLDEIRKYNLEKSSSNSFNVQSESFLSMFWHFLLFYHHVINVKGGESL